MTPGWLLIDISCHLISPCFSFTHSSCLIHPPSLPQNLCLVNKDAQTDSLALSLLRRDAQEWTSGDNFPQGQPNLRQLRSKITDP